MRWEGKLQRGKWWWGWGGQLHWEWGDGKQEDQDWQDTSMQKYTKKKKIGTGMANGKILFYVFFGVWTT